MTREEYRVIVHFLADLPEDVRKPVLTQDQDVPWPGTDEKVTYQACRFLDQRNGLCLVYPVRPLVCRLFGHVEWLPCPVQRVRVHWESAHEVMHTRVGREKTWAEWEAEDTETKAI